MDLSSFATLFKLYQDVARVKMKGLCAMEPRTDEKFFRLKRESKKGL